MSTTGKIKTQQENEVQAASAVLDEVVRAGARRMLAEVLESEVEEFLAAHAARRDERGRRQVVRNGYLPERDLVTGAGQIPVRQPRVRDHEGKVRFSSNILPPYLRRTPSIDTLIPALYLKGVSTGDFGEALSAILGEGAAGLSASNIVRLKQVWEQEYEDWSRRDLSNKHYVYLWADGVHFNVRLEEDRTCILVLMGAMEDGRKELVAVWDGYRESTASWQELMRNLKHRGLQHAPSLAIGDGALGFWNALADVFPETRRQRCWVHKTANVLDKMPKRVQPRAKAMLHEIYLAPTRQDAQEAWESFLSMWEAKYPKACHCLRKDEPDLLTFYDYPAEHWTHLRTTNPIESTFGTVRHRTRRTKGCGSAKATLTMVWKLCCEAEKKWRRLNGAVRIAQVLEGVRFVDGVVERENAA